VQKWREKFQIERLYYSKEDIVTLRDILKRVTESLPKERRQFSGMNVAFLRRSQQDV
jgi:hypothetical protein